MSIILVHRYNKFSFFACSGKTGNNLNNNSSEYIEMVSLAQFRKRHRNAILFALRLNPYRWT